MTASKNQLPEARKRAVEAAISEIRKAYGKTAIMRIGEQGSWGDAGSVSTGCPELDDAIGTGGFPRGRVVEVFGHESSGKSTICLHAVGEIQKSGGVAAYVDAEHALDPVYAEQLGVDSEALLVSQPDCAEEALDIVETLVRSGGIDLIIVDSVAALVPKDELEGEITDHHVGLQARIMTKALRRLTGVISKTGSVVVFINQLREKIGIRFGNPETTPGGRALKFFSSLRLDVRRTEKITRNGEVTGFKVRVTVVKNKVAPPFKRAELIMSYQKGIDTGSMFFDRALKEGVIERAGCWYSFREKRLGQGKEQSESAIKDNPEILLEIEKALQIKRNQLAVTKADVSRGNPSNEDKALAA